MGLHLCYLKGLITLCPALSQIEILRDIKYNDLDYAIIQIYIQIYNTDQYNDLDYAIKQIYIYMYIYIIQFQ